MRRIELMEEEGVEFLTNANIGINVDAQQLKADHDAVVLAAGATQPRDLPVPGRHLNGIHFAMEFLTKNQKRLFLTREGNLESGWENGFVSAEGKDVIVIGGGPAGLAAVQTAKNMGAQVYLFDVRAAVKEQAKVSSRAAQ